MTHGLLFSGVGGFDLAAQRFSCMRSCGLLTLNYTKMTSIDLLKEIESWLSFNTEPSKEETAKLRKSIKEHLAEQLRIHDVVGQSKQYFCLKEQIEQRCSEQCLGCFQFQNKG